MCNIARCSYQAFGKVLQAGLEGVLPRVPPVQNGYELLHRKTKQLRCTEAIQANKMHNPVLFFKKKAFQNRKGDVEGLFLNCIQKSSEVFYDG